MLFQLRVAFLAKWTEIMAEILETQGEENLEVLIPEDLIIITIRHKEENILFLEKGPEGI